MRPQAVALLRWLPGLVGILGTVAAWHLISEARGNVPSPEEVVTNIWTNLFSSDRLPGIGLPKGGYFPHVVSTALNVLLGGTVGAFVGTISGLFSASSQRFGDVASPIATLIGTVPIVIMGPFFLLWFGLSGLAQFALVAMYTATTLHLFAKRGAENMPKELLEYASILGTRGWDQFFHLRLPGSLPEIFGGLRIAFAGAWGLAAVTEMLGAQFGSGRVITALRAVYDLTGIMAVVLLLGAMAILLDILLLALRRYILRWKIS